MVQVQEQSLASEPEQEIAPDNPKIILNRFGFDSTLMQLSSKLFIIKINSSSPSSSYILFQLIKAKSHSCYPLRSPDTVRREIDVEWAR